MRVVIVGGGTGCIAALLLARAGHQVPVATGLHAIGDCVCTTDPTLGRVRHVIFGDPVAEAPPAPDRDELEAALGGR